MRDLVELARQYAAYADQGGTLEGPSPPRSLTANEWRTIAEKLEIGSSEKCATHVFAARKIHKELVDLAEEYTKDRSDDPSYRMLVEGVGDDSDLHKAVHDALEGKCAQDWIDEQIKQALYQELVLDGKLPCDVMVAPATILRKGLPIETLVSTLSRRIGKSGDEVTLKLRG